MLTAHRFDIAQVSLRRDPVEECRFSGLVTESLGLKCLLRLRDEFVAKQLNVMMHCLYFFQLIAYESERFLLLAIQSMLSGADAIAGFAHSSRIFAGIYPWDRE